MAGENLKEIFKQQFIELQQFVAVWDYKKSSGAQDSSLPASTRKSSNILFATPQKLVQKNTPSSSFNTPSSSSNSNSLRDLPLSISHSSSLSVMSETPTATLQTILSSLEKLIDLKNASASADAIQKLLCDYIFNLISYYKFCLSSRDKLKIQMDKIGGLLEQVLSCFNCESYFLFGPVKISINYEDILNIYTNVVSDKQFISQKTKDLLLYALVKSEHFGQSEYDVGYLADFMKRINVLYGENELDELIVAVRANQENIIEKIERLLSQLDFLILNNGDGKYENLIPIILDNARVFCNQYHNSNERLFKLVDESGKKTGILGYYIGEIIGFRDLLLESGKNYPEYTQEEINKKLLFMNLSAYLDNLLLNIIQGSPDENKWLLLIESCCEITRFYENGSELKEIFEKIAKFREQIVGWLLTNKALVWGQNTSVKFKKETYQQLLKILFNYEDTGQLCYRILSYLSGSEEELYGLSLTKEDKLAFRVLLAKYWYNEISKSLSNNQYQWFEIPALFTAILETTNEKKLERIDLFGIEDPVHAQDLCANYLGEVLSCANAKYSNFKLTLEPDNIEELLLFYSSVMLQIFNPVLLDLVKIVSGIPEFEKNNRMPLFFTAHITLCLLYAAKNNIEKIRAALVFQANDLSRGEKEIFNLILKERCDNWLKKYSDDIEPENQDLGDFYALLGGALHEHGQQKEQDHQILIDGILEKIREKNSLWLDKLFFLDEKTEIKVGDWLCLLKSHDGVFNAQKFLEILSSNMNHDAVLPKAPLKILMEFDSKIIDFEQAKKALERHYASRAYQEREDYRKNYGLESVSLGFGKNKVELLPLDYLNLLAGDNEEDKKAGRAGLLAKKCATEVAVIHSSVFLSSPRGKKNTSFPSPSPAKEIKRNQQQSSSSSFQLDSPSILPGHKKQQQPSNFRPIRTPGNSSLFGSSNSIKFSFSTEQLNSSDKKYFSIENLNFELKPQGHELEETMTLKKLMSYLHVRSSSFIDIIKGQLDFLSEDGFLNMLPEIKANVSEELINKFVEKIKSQTVQPQEVEAVKRQILILKQYQHEPNTQALVKFNCTRRLASQSEKDILAEFSSIINDELKRDPEACLDYFRRPPNPDAKLKYVWLTSYFGIKLLENRMLDAYLTSKEFFICFLSSLVAREDDPALSIQVFSNIIRAFNNMGFVYSCVVVEEKERQYVLNKELSCFKNSNEIEEGLTSFILYDSDTGVLSQLIATKVNAALISNSVNSNSESELTPSSSSFQ